ncbi:MAG: transcriptional regulator [Evtepia sp.]|nr:transcriptional regulator [Evtepia sp.]
MKNDRLFQILYRLLQKKNITAPELAKQLEVSVRTIYRDIEALSIAGIPVYTSPGKGGGISLMDGYTVDKALLSDDEQNEILFAIQSLKTTGQDMDALLQKMGTVFQKTNTDWIEIDFSRWGFGQTDSVKYELLKQGILQKKVLHILYCNMFGENSERKIQPIKLVFKEKSWYLQAFCLKAEDFRLFKISRIMELNLTDMLFDENLSLTPRPDVEAPPSSPTITLTLKFAPSMAFRLFDEFDHSLIHEQEDGSFLATADFPLDGWVYSYLLSFGTAVEILQPKELRAQLADYAKKIYEHHKT